MVNGAGKHQLTGELVMTNNEDSQLIFRIRYYNQPYDENVVPSHYINDKHSKNYQLLFIIMFQANQCQNIA